MRIICVKLNVKDLRDVKDLKDPFKKTRNLITSKQSALKTL